MKTGLKSKLHILNMLNEYAGKKTARFHMPGHKAVKAFSKLFPQAAVDITELDFSDNLDNPSGVIEKVESEIAQILGAKKSFIITDGSTCGIYAMLKAAKSFGSKVIICRNSHKSVYNACEILGIEPIVLNHNFKHNVMLPPSHEEIEGLIKKDAQILGALITTPDYYGNMADTARIAQILRDNQKLFLIDGAHGSHLKFSESGEMYAGNFADMWVDGLHKTLPCLTQTALVSTSKEQLIQPLADALSYFRTSSPSYSLMASAEYGLKFMKEYGHDAFNNLFFYLSSFKKRLSAKKYKFYKSDDFLKLAVDFKEVGVSAEFAHCYLQSRGIYSEFCDGRYIMFYLSAQTTLRELGYLEKTLKRVLRLKQFKNTYKQGVNLTTGKKHFSYLVACEMESELVPVDKSIGRVCAKNAGIFPPCVPLVVAGEVITQETAAVLKAHPNVFGMMDKKIFVVKE